MSGILPADRLEVEARPQTERMAALDRLDRDRIEELAEAREIAGSRASTSGPRVTRPLTSSTASRIA